MAKAVALGKNARGRSAPNPNVGCVIVSSSGRVVGKGATASGGRPHAEAAALAEAGKRALGSTVYVTLEPCTHQSERGPACTDLLLEARPARVVIGLKDPDPRTAGKGIRRLRRADIDVTMGVERKSAKHSLAGWLTRLGLGRPRNHAQARAVDRRQDRASVGQIEMDHWRGCSAACPCRTCAQRHDPGRARDLSGRRAEARRPPPWPRGQIAETGSPELAAMRSQGGKS